jgi:uncharacterized membrane protein YjgN (DUF898 family)
MTDTIPAALEPLLPAAPASRPFGRAEPVRHRLPISFTGSGSEYFRIWIVNLLLTLVTLGLYFPWAKVRRLRYFYGNTSVGEHPFDFHGEPRRMLRGFLLVGALVLLYGLSSKVSPVSGLIALVIVAALWPALLRASQQFRMANTSWRGLRFRFNGDMAGAYKAMLPLFVPGVLTLAVTLFAGPQETAKPGATPSTAGAGLVVLVALGAMLLLPLFLWMLKKYQHGHYALGQLQTELRTSAGSFYAVALKTLGVGLLAALAGAAVALVFGGGSVFALMSGGGGKKGAASVATVVAIVIAVFLIYASIILIVQPYVVSRLQNLVWGRTGSSQVRFESNLRFWPLFRLTLKNLLLTMLTLGLYWPFAKVAMARMRLEAVTVVTRLSPDELVGSLRERADDAAGDAAGDLFGIDIGL